MGTCNLKAQNGILLARVTAISFDLRLSIKSIYNFQKQSLGNMAFRNEILEKISDPANSTSLKER